jgi:murein DD-endopeptidase MepM/ murein hydrolase activator NlpD
MTLAGRTQSGRVLAGLCTAGATFLAACETTYAAPPAAFRPPPAGYVGGVMHGAYAGPVSYAPPRRQVGAPEVYRRQAPQGAVRTHARLRLCDGRASGNIGPVSRDREALAFTPVIASPAGSLLRNPTDGACLSSGFGYRGAASGGSANHEGIDLANPDGGFIRAAGAGRVVAAGWRGNYGLYVELDHGRGVRTAYGHFSELNPKLRPGVRVAQGEALGRMGATGNATGVHLHYEVKVGGRPVDPLNYAPSARR